MPRTHAALVLLALTPCALAQQVDSFTLIAVPSDQPVPAFDPIPDGATINLYEVGEEVAVRANVSGGVGSVVFALSGAQSRNQTENVAPYALFGDNSGDYDAWAPALGTYTLSATAFAGLNGAGAGGPGLTIGFTIEDVSGPVNAPPAVDAGADVVLAAGATAATLTGAASDADGTVESVRWTQVGGPGATLVGDDTLTLDVSGLVEAFYVFRLEAKDDDGASASDTVRVTVGTPTSDALVTGELRAWHRVGLEFQGPFVSETHAPSPFLEYRMDVTFTDGVRTFVVPGFFAADGDALDTGATSGDRWRVYFAPPSAGQWDYAVSFRRGAEIAVSDDPIAGTPVAFDGASGTLTIAPTDKERPDFRADGRLLYDGTHYLRFEGSGRYWAKGGVDSPENWLGYTGFDNTFDGGAGPNTPDGLHAFPTHVMDWNPGDPDWDRNHPPGANDGRAIIGALNYLHSTGVNSIYFLPMNIGGDGKDTWPYVGPINPNGGASNDNTRFDVSKLEQWEVVFGHAQTLGLHLHFVLNEAETPNKRELDDATVGVERLVFYRELAARFGHHNALQWNVCEEFNLNLNIGSAEALNWARAISEADPYGHPVTVHNAGNGVSPGGAWAPFIAQPDIDLTSLQDARQTDGWSDAVEEFRAATAAAGRPIPSMIDEPGSPTRDFAGDFDDFRKSIVWPILLSGGGGEWFINDRDQSLEDFREFDQIWTETGRALRFLELVPFWLMEPDDAVVVNATGGFDGPQAFAQVGGVYALYLPAGGTGVALDLGSSDAAYRVRWFDPRADRPLLDGSVTAITGPGLRAIGDAPDTPSEDWAVLIERIDACAGADFDGDGDVDLGDFGVFGGAFGSRSGDDNYDGRADFDGDGDVDLGDFGVFGGAFGRTDC
ncbi:MAG: DUF5060 domain-containing protein [Planctomycetota bacterium]